jgi:hypothetical protein
VVVTRIRSMIPRLLGVTLLAVGLAAPGAAAAPTPLSWGTPAIIDKLQGGLTDVSCTGYARCAGVDDSGQVVMFDGTSWSAPTQLTGTDEFRGFKAVSCRGSLFCVSVGDETGLWEYHGTAWQEVSVNVPSELIDVSCSSATTCVAITTDAAMVRRTAAGWGALTRVAPSGYLASAVSCPHRDFCVAAVRPSVTSVGGYVATFNGVSWSRPLRIDRYSYLTSLSCPSSSFCTATDAQGYVLRYRGSTWGSRHLEAIAADKISCLSRSFCVAAEYGGDAAIWSGSWRLTHVAPSGTTPGVACISTTRCFASEYLGYVTPYVSGTWQRAERHDIDHTSGRLVQVSCASATFCLAVDEFANVSRYDGAHWSVAHRVKPFALGFDLVSCPTTSFCMVLAPGTYSWTFDGTSWHGPLDAADSARYALSCSGTHFCMSAGLYSGPTVYRGTAWRPTSGADRVPLESMSCVNASFCIAVSPAGHPLRYDGTSWHLGSRLTDGQHAWSVSCSATSFCMAADGTDTVYLRRSGTWSTETFDLAASLFEVDCTASTFCIGLADNGLVEFDGSTWTDVSSPNVDSAYDVSCVGSTFCAAIDTYRASIGTAG